jgi:predicted ester cyclase
MRLRVRQPGVIPTTQLKSLASTVTMRDSGVLVEGVITGTHDGDWAGVPATGRHIKVPVVGIFEFDADRLLCEKVHLNMGRVLKQMGARPGCQLEREAGKD